MNKRQNIKGEIIMKLCSQCYCSLNYVESLECVYCGESTCTVCHQMKHAEDGDVVFVCDRCEGKGQKVIEKIRLKKRVTKKELVAFINEKSQEYKAVLEGLGLKSEDFKKLSGQHVRIYKKYGSMYMIDEYIKVQEVVSWIKQRSDIEL